MILEAKNLKKMDVGGLSGENCTSDLVSWTECAFLNGNSTTIANARLPACGGNFNQLTVCTVQRRSSRILAPVSLRVQSANSSANRAAITDEANSE